MPADTPGRGEHLALAHDPLLGGGGPVVGEGVVGQPVGGGGLALEDPGGAEEERSGAHRGGVGGRLVGLADPVDDRAAVPGHLAGDDPAGDQEHVGVRHLVEGVLDVEDEEPVVVGEEALLLRADDDLRAGEEAEHLVRADGVEGGELGVEADGDLHAPTMRLDGAWRQRQITHGSSQAPRAPAAWQPDPRAGDGPLRRVRAVPRERRGVRAALRRAAHRAPRGGRGRRRAGA